MQAVVSSPQRVGAPAHPSAAEDAASCRKARAAPSALVDVRKAVGPPREAPLHKAVEPPREALPQQAVARRVEARP